MIIVKFVSFTGMNQLITSLERYGPVSDADKEFIRQRSIRREYGKHQHIIREGHVCNHIYFVLSGLTRFYYVRDGRDITSSFGVADSSLTAIDSLLSRRATRLNLETLEPTQLIALHYDDLMALYAQSHAMERTGRLITLEYLKFADDRLYALQFYTAQERYENFLVMFPDLLNRVSLTHIASYLGITLETLSRIRANLINVKG